MIVANALLPTPEEADRAGRDAVCQAVGEFVAEDYDEFGGKKMGRAMIVRVAKAVKEDRIGLLEPLDVFLLWDAVGCSGLLCDEDHPGAETIARIYEKANVIFGGDTYRQEWRQNIYAQIDALEAELQLESEARWEAECKAIREAEKAQEVIARVHTIELNSHQNVRPSRDRADRVISKAKSQAATILAKAKIEAATIREIARSESIERLQLRPASDPNGSAFPLPPESFVTLTAAMSMWLGKCGIYFVIRGGSLAYVGKSVNLTQRWRSHHVIEPTDMIGVVELPAGHIGLAESHYIWSLRPPLNGEIRAMNRINKQPAGDAD